MTLSANDFAGGSGIASIEYLLDGGGWTTYSGPLVVSGEGSHSLQFHATDNAGNVEGVKSKSFTIDTTGPVVSITTPSAGEQLDALLLRHAGVLVHRHRARASRPARARRSVETGPIGSHTYTVTATDNAGNTTTLTHTYDVVWPFSWVSPPSSGKAGKSVAVKFSLGGNYGTRGPERDADVPAGQLHDRRLDGLLLERERLAQLLGRHVHVLLELVLVLEEHLPHAHAPARRRHLAQPDRQVHLGPKRQAGGLYPGTARPVVSFAHGSRPLAGARAALAARSSSR